MSIEKETLLEKISKSLENANNLLKLKGKIESDILQTLNIVTEITNNAVEFSIFEKNGDYDKYESSARLVKIIKPSSGIIHSGFIFLGFSINEKTGYPMVIETEANYYVIKDESELSDVLVNIIDQRALAIMKLISESQDDDIPF
ncbi:hypothetical protein H2Y56_06365 [Pectobacterium aroidearum]|uniref:GAF domain-containing protein n=1 Tax=Pectobacterium aroidearum TaxID=1201031 RepID=A0ABR5ZB59_9GAMM|nr:MULTISPECIES: hypothetical protein [Pectobacterium]MBA5198944.1 hypothetical protein [Pectobacterium aroidearum]MBA5226586.1 hypothetical protein [Pectobacterium aroidearum]MBA5231736.1 hypothetical protein [Pectobacterium aroidearum]MBA5736891.1 hypothetical protein [Pectobacterium aroidearum]UXJ98947.1 hypothetical protein N5056_14120 [Pectobacterium aroidearum]